MYFNVNFYVFFKLIKVHLLVSEMYIYQNARYKNKKTPPTLFIKNCFMLVNNAVYNYVYIEMQQTHLPRLLSSDFYGSSKLTIHKNKSVLS